MTKGGEGEEVPEPCQAVTLALEAPRRSRRRPHLALQGDELRVFAPVLFRATLVLTRSEIAAVVDLSSTQSWARAPVLVRLARIVHLPTGSRSTRANLGLVFSAPVALPPLRFGAGQVLGLSRRSIRRSVGMDALTVAAADLTASMVALTSWGLPVGWDVQEELAHTIGAVSDPIEAARIGDRRRRRRWWAGAFGVVLFLAIVAFQFSLVVLPRFQRWQNCAEVRERLSEPAAVVSDPSPPPLPASLPPNIGPEWTLVEDVARDLDAAAESRRDPVEGRRQLAQAGYDQGWSRIWEDAEGEFVISYAYDFASPEGALDYDRYANEYVCQFSDSVFTLADVPDAIGQQIPYLEGTIAEQVTFVRGNRRYYIDLRQSEVPNSREPIARLVQLIPAIAEMSQ